jgi:hypothetical protein
MECFKLDAEISAEIAKNWSVLTLYLRSCSKLHFSPLCIFTPERFTYLKYEALKYFENFSMLHVKRCSPSHWQYSSAHRLSGCHFPCSSMTYTTMAYKYQQQKLLDLDITRRRWSTMIISYVDPTIIFSFRWSKVLVKALMLQSNLLLSGIWLKRGAAAWSSRRTSQNDRRLHWVAQGCSILNRILL